MSLGTTILLAVVAFIAIAALGLYIGILVTIKWVVEDVPKSISGRKGKRG